MSSTDYSSPDAAPGTHSRCSGGLCGGGHWSGANIFAMALGFIIFPPLGLVVLVWTLVGRPIQDLPAWVQRKWSQLTSGMRSSTHGDSDNVVFNEYQQTQYDRIREIKEEIGRRAEAFKAFRFDAKRRQDRKEFDDFMSTNPGNGEGPRH